jgi:hypothetical protein
MKRKFSKKFWRNNCSLEIEIRYALQHEPSQPISDLPLVVEFMKNNSTTGIYQQLNSTSKYFFHYEGAYQVSISNLRITCQRAFDYFVYTLLLIRWEINVFQTVCKQAFCKRQA